MHGSSATEARPGARSLAVPRPPAAAAAHLLALLITLHVVTAAPAVQVALASGATDGVQSRLVGAAGALPAAAPENSTVRWVPVVPSPDGGDCLAACAAAGLKQVNSTNYFGDPDRTDQTLCAFPYTGPSYFSGAPRCCPAAAPLSCPAAAPPAAPAHPPALPASPAAPAACGVTAGWTNGQGCRYYNYDSGALATAKRAAASDPPFYCACAAPWSATWRMRSGGFVRKCAGTAVSATEYDEGPCSVEHEGQAWFGGVFR